MRADTSTTPFDLTGFATVGLAEVVEDAARLTRVDRKYIVERDLANGFLRGLPDTFRVLSVAGRSATTYSSTYFDTAGLDACRDHVKRRRRRWKVRSRVYVEDRLCRIEVKSKDGRGVTVKAFADSSLSRHGRLEGSERAFVTGTLRELDLPVDVESLRPSMSVDYRRVTLADTQRGLRITLDWGVECRLADGRVRLDDGFVLVETKGGSIPSEADRLLTSLGTRPQPFSKYASAASLLREDIPDNDVRRLHGRVLHADWTPEAVSA